MTLLVNPFTTVAVQHTSWGHLKDDTEYHFEFLLPFKAVIKEQGIKQGNYYAFCVEVLETQKSNIVQLTEKELVIVEIPYKTFTREWNSVDGVLRRRLTENDNVRIRFRKNSKASVTFLEYERLVATPEHIEFANKHYSELKNQANEYEQRLKAVGENQDR